MLIIIDGLVHYFPGVESESEGGVAAAPIIMLRRLYRSISSRIRNSYREALGRTFQRAVVSYGYTPLHAKPIAPFTLLLYAGSSQLAMLRECLWSIYHAWPLVPSVLLVSDGSISEQVLLDAIAWWPGPRTAESWKVSAEAHATKGRPKLRDFAQKQMLGKKLSAVLESGENRPTLYCDSDILWLNGPPPLPQMPERSQAVSKLALDPYRHYDNDLIAEGSISELDAAPWLNTGLCFVHGPVFDTCRLDRLMNILSKRQSYFSEQTILAYATKILGNQHWTFDQIMLKVDDLFWPIWPSGETQPWLARHYVGDVRHWFWRDALRLRMIRAARGYEKSSRTLVHHSPASAPAAK